MYSGGQNRADREGYVAFWGEYPGVGLDERLGLPTAKRGLPAAGSTPILVLSVYSIRGGGRYA